MDHADIKQKIQAELDRTEAALADYREQSRPVAPDEAIGRISRMDAINNKSVTEAAMRQAESKLQQLQYALRKVDSPDFGICLQCNQPIPLGRLLIKPESAYCVHCAR